MGLICQSLGKLEQARVYWSKALEIDGDYVEAKANRAMSYSESNSSMAIEELERLAQTYKDEAVIFYYLGRLYLERGQDDKAWPAAIRAKELAPMSDEVRVVLGTLALKEGQTTNAKIYFEKAVLLNEYNIAALLGLADIASRENDFEKAEKGYKRVLELAPKNFDAHNNFAELLYKQKRTAEALEEYRQAVIINPRSAEVSNNLAVILRDCGDYEQALGLLFNAYVLKPELEQISINLAETLTLYQRQQPEEALKIAENWVRQAPENILPKRPPPLLREKTLKIIKFIVKSCLTVLLIIMSWLSRIWAIQFRWLWDELLEMLKLPLWIWGVVRGWLVKLLKALGLLSRE